MSVGLDMGEIKIDFKKLGIFTFQNELNKKFFVAEKKSRTRETPNIFPPMLIEAPITKENFV